MPTPPDLSRITCIDLSLEPAPVDYLEAMRHFNCHAHLAGEDFGADRDAVRQRAAAAGGLCCWRQALGRR